VAATEEIVVVAEKEPGCISLPRHREVRVLEVQRQNDAVAVGVVPRGMHLYIVEGKPLALNPGTPDLAQLHTAAIGHEQPQVESPDTNRSTPVWCDFGPRPQPEVLCGHHSVLPGKQLSKERSGGECIGIVDAEVADRREVPAEGRVVGLGMFEPSGPELLRFCSEIAPAGLERLEDVSAALDVEEAVRERRLGPVNDAVR